MQRHAIPEEELVGAGSGTRRGAAGARPPAWRTQRGMEAEAIWIGRWWIFLDRHGLSGVGRLRVGVYPAGVGGVGD